MKPLRVIFVGGGNRANKYASIMAEMPDKYEIVAVADAQSIRREQFHDRYGVPEENIYDDWRKLLAQPKMADVAMIATQDNMHYEPALEAIAQGYDLLLEKPVAQTAQECADIAAAAREKGVKVLVCHVLRYTPFYGRIKQLLMEGLIGEVMSVTMVEAIGNTHFSHSYLRGPWKSEKESTPMLIAKSCHDLDMIQWLLDKPCKRVQSFGSLTHFTKANAPEGAPVRCADGGCPVGDTCPYNCVRYYHDNPKNGWRNHLVVGINKGKYGDTTNEDVMTALKTRDYGLCVYQANNDVVDHQVVNMEFEGGATASFSVNAFNRGGRYIRLFGTKGELYAFAGSEEITVFTFEDRNKFKVPVEATEESIWGGHGGGDPGIVRELYDYLSDAYTGFRAADIETSVRNHLIGFAAEQSRHENIVVDMDEVYRKYGFDPVS